MNNLPPQTQPSSPVKPQNTGLRLFDHACEGLIFCLEAKRSDLLNVQEGLTVLPIHFDQPVYCLDGVNAFDPYPYSKAARQAGLNVEDVLERVKVSRCFTIHQLRASAEQLFPPLLELNPKPLVLIMGIENLFLDESLPLWERKHCLQKTIKKLEEFRDDGLPMLITHEPENEGKLWWKEIIQSTGDCIASLQSTKDNKHDLIWSRKKGEHNHGKNHPDFQHVSPG